MPGNPHKPTHPDNPVGQTQRIRQTRTAWRRHIRPIRKWLIETLQDMPKERITGNIRDVFHAANSHALAPVEVCHGTLSVNRYDYLIDANELQRIVDELSRRMSTDEPVRAIEQRVRAAYEQGTGDEVQNLIAISDGQYTREITQVLSSDAWQRRVALIQSRVFEEMRGFQGDTATDLARVLREGVENGLNPRDVARQLRNRFDVSQSRAERLARTEITQAYRRARLDEDEDANQRLGIRTRLLWFSALLPTTRDNHASRHGQTYTQDEVRDFYSQPGESINCRCSQSSVLVDSDGNPVNPGFVEEVRARRSR